MLMKFGAIVSVKLMSFVSNYNNEEHVSEKRTLKFKTLKKAYLDILIRIFETRFSKGDNQIYTDPIR